MFHLLMMYFCIYKYSRMKKDQLNIRISPEDKETLAAATEKLEQQTGQKLDASKTIRESIRRVAEEKPDLFFVNRPAIREIDRNIGSGLIKLQKVLDEFLAVAGKPITLDELQPLYGTGRKDYGVVDREGLKALVISRLVEGKRTSVGGIQLSEEMLKSMIILPDLTALIDSASQLYDVPMVALRDVFYWNAYEIRDGKAVVITDMVEIIKGSFRASATTKAEKKKLTRVRAICRALDAFIADKDVPIEKINMTGICYYDYETGRFEPSEQYVLFGLTPRLIFET